MSSAGANTWNVPLEINNLEAQIAQVGAGAVQSVSVGNANLTLSGTAQNPILSGTLVALTSNVATTNFALSGNTAGNPSFVLTGTEEFKVITSDLTPHILVSGGVSGGVQLGLPSGYGGYKVTAPTVVPANTSDTQVATTAFVQSAITAIPAGVSSFSGSTTGLTPAVPTTGAVVLGGTLAVANGGTGVITSTGTGSVVLSANPALSGVPTAPTATLATNTTQVATTAFVQSAITAIPAGVSSFSGSTTGLTPAVPTTGAITLSGTLAVANGGTGVIASTGANSVALRDASQNISAVSFTGALVGNASTATTATTATNATNTAITASSTNATFFPTFVSATTGNLPQLVDTTLTYNPSTDTLTVANVAGNASTATRATNIAGGLGGSIPYQTAVNTTALLANGTAGQVLTSAGTTLAPNWLNGFIAGKKSNSSPQTFTSTIGTQLVLQGATAGQGNASIIAPANGLAVPAGRVGWYRASATWDTALFAPNGSNLQYNIALANNNIDFNFFLIKQTGQMPSTSIAGGGSLSVVFYSGANTNEIITLRTENFGFTVVINACSLTLEFLGA